MEIFVMVKFYGKQLFAWFPKGAWTSEIFLVFGRLTGRGTVEFIIEKVDGGTFFPTAGGQPQTLATVQVCGNWNLRFHQLYFTFESSSKLSPQVILDGYSAPLTAGNFAKLVRYPNLTCLLLLFTFICLGLI